MPSLPWRKPRSGRVSRVFALLQRRDSFVVETGFPTSLVDLFVMHRDRIKKPSVNKRQQQQKPRPGSNSADDRAVSPVQSEEGTPPAPQNPRFEPVAKSAALGDVDDGFWRANAVFLAALKMLVVVVFAFATKKLALGISMSVCFLLFLEFLGRYPLCRRRRKPDVPVGSEIQPSDSSFCKENETVEWDEPWEDELQNAEAESDALKQGTALLGSREPAAKVKLMKKSMMRRLLPKKLRSLGKRRSRKGAEEMSSDSSVGSATHGGQQDPRDAAEDAEKSLSCPLGVDLKQEDGGDVAVSEALPAGEETASGGSRKGKSGRWILLVVVVLAGLVGGRIMALALTMAGCLTLRFAAKVAMVG